MEVKNQHEEAIFSNQIDKKKKKNGWFGHLMTGIARKGNSSELLSNLGQIT